MRITTVHVGNQDVTNALYSSGSNREEIPFRQEGDIVVLNLYLMFKDIQEGNVIIDVEMIDAYGTRTTLTNFCFIVQSKEELVEDVDMWDPYTPAVEEEEWNPYPRMMKEETFF